MTLTTREPISYLEIVQDGLVRNTIRFEDYVKDGRLPPLHFKQSGWFLLRAVAEISDTYRFAMTGPYYVEFGNKPRISKKSAQFFLDWVYERARQIRIDDPQQRQEVMAVSSQGAGFLEEPCGEGQCGMRTGVDSPAVVRVKYVNSGTRSDAWRLDTR